MKQYLTMIIASATLALAMPPAGTAQQTYVPDDNFEKELIELGLDSGELDDYVTTANIATVTVLYMEEKEISDLTGIEDFTALKKLYCYDNSIASLDISKCTALEDLSCYRNGLTSLDVSSCSSLEYLRCYDNLLTSLNVEDCNSLIFLDCEINLLTTLDVSKCTVMEELVCVENSSLTSINTTGLSLLKFLNCNDSKLASLDVSTNPALYNLNCNNNALTTLNASGCVNLEWLFCSNNLLASINLSNCTSLDWLVCNDNSLATIDVSENLLVRSIICNNNLLTSLDVSINSVLLQLICHNNALTSLNLQNGNNMNMLGEEGYAGLDARTNPNLTCIQVDDVVASSGYQYWFKDAMASYSNDCGSSSVGDHFSEGYVKLFPNPASSLISIQLATGTRRDAYLRPNSQHTIEIYDLNGRKLLERLIPMGMESIDIDVSSLGNGIYFFRLSSQKHIGTKKIIIRK